MPAEDFEMRTRLLFEPTENYQFAGLLVFEDENNLLNFGRAFCDPSHVDCVGNGIYFDYIQDGVRIGSNFATPISTAGEVYLRLVRQGEWYTGYASPNGTAWTVIGGHEFEEDPAGIGLYANNQALGDAEINADFDFFLLEFELSRVFLPLAMGSE